MSAYDLMQAGVASLLAGCQDLEVLPERTAAYDADVVLYDVLRLHEGDGADLERIVKEPGVAVLALTRDLRPDLADRALLLGAHGCVSSDAPAAELEAAVRAAARGELRGDGSAGTTDFTANPSLRGHNVGLSQRESEVLGLITAGLRNEQIAEELFLSINSVKSYIRSAYRRIGADSRSQAVAWCMQNGFGAAPPHPAE